MLKKLQRGLKNNSLSRTKMVIIIIILIMLVLIAMRIWAAYVLKQETNAHATPIVKTTPALHSLVHHEIVLPGTVTAWHEAPIFARTDGYVKKWYVDIGDHVDTGSLLADIETPELDAQLRQAEANLNVVIANNKLAQTTAVRWKNLLKTDSVSKQETDEKVDTAIALAASVIAARAERDRLKELVGFERVIAPFKGIISDRSTDYGALINSGSNPAQAKPLFRIVQIDPLRIYVKIPQTYSSRINPKLQISLEFAEHPGQRFLAKLINTAHAIDPITRTLLAEFEVQNKDGILLPGGYTSVHFTIPTYPDAVRLPINTLIFRKEGMQVATLDKDSRVVLKKITISRDFKNFVEVDSGIRIGEQIIINPPDAITVGEKMKAIPDKGDAS